MEVSIFSIVQSAQAACISPPTDSQLLAQGAAGFRRPAGLNANDLHQVDNAARVFYFILFARKDFDLHGHGRVRFLLSKARVRAEVPRQLIARVKDD